MPSEKITYKQACEHIAKAGFLKFADTDQPATPEQIFNYSPTGELAEIYTWYQLACEKLGGTYSEQNKPQP
jgi:hypothetical protein